MENLTALAEKLKNLIESKLWAKVLVAMFLGVLLGFALNSLKDQLSETIIGSIANWLSFPGKLFMKLIQMIMIALIVSSILSGITGSSVEQLRNVGVKAVLYFLFTTVVAVTIGALVAYMISPGKYMPIGFKGELKLSESPQPNINLASIPDLLLSLIPENPLQSMITGDMLSLVVFSIIIGVAILNLSPHFAQPVTKMLNAIQSICMNIVKGAMKIVPYAVFGIMASLVATTGKESFKGLGFYVLAVILGLFILLIFYMFLVVFIGKTQPISFLKKSQDAILLAFSTTSSAAAMPITLQVAIEKFNIRKSLSNIIVPLGATINMDGTAMYQCISFIFLAQVYGLPLGLLGLGVSMLTIVAASIGTPAVPGAGIIVLASVLQNAGIPSEGVMVIIGMERILGMFRSAINVTGDLTACVVLDKILADYPEELEISAIN
jgi:Na+/H+-dicarboxylate symporter